MLYGITAQEALRSPIRQATANFRGIGNLDVVADLLNPLAQGSAVFQGSGSLNVSAQLQMLAEANFAGAGNLTERPRTVFSTTFNNNGDISAGMSWRQLITPLSAGGSLVRVTLKAANDGPYQLDHVSIGVQTTTYNTADTPVELLFNGSSGFSISTDQTIVSDWAKLSFTASQKIVVIGDAGTGGAEAFKQTGITCVFYNLASTASYNVASPAGSWGSQSATSVVQTVESLG